MEFHDLEVFVAVARERSFSRAAKAVLRTQPAVSLAIRRLEDELDERLFDRSNKEPVLTYEGELLLDYAEKLLNLRQEIRPALLELRNLHRGKVRIGANEIGVMCLLPYITRYRQHYPDVQLEIVRTHSSEIPHELLKRNIDLGILSYPPEDAGLASIVVMIDGLSLVVYPSHPLAKKKEVSIKELGDARFAAHGSMSFYRQHVVQLFEKHAVPLHIDVELPTIESIKRFVESEQALAIIPRMCVEDELKRGSLVHVKVKELNIKRKIHLIYRKGDPLSHVPKAFVRLIVPLTEKARKGKTSKILTKETVKSKQHPGKKITR